MRHRRRGRTLGRKPNHQRALLRNLASSLFLTERDDELDEAGLEYRSFDAPNKPKVKGRIVTTLQKAKEVRPLVEKCITIARKSLAAEEDARQYATTAKRGSEEWKDWRNGDQWQQWNQAIAPAVAARRRALKLLGNRQAVNILFDDIAARFVDRDGGYTRVVRLATPRLGDAGTRALLEFVGTNDRIRQKSAKPQFDDDEIADEETAEEDESARAEADEEVTADDADSPQETAAAEDSSEEADEEKEDTQPEKDE